MSIEYINHCNAIRLRVKGEGNLRATLYSYDEVESNILEPIVIAASTNIPPTQLANFKQTEMKLRLETTAIDEIFNISEILVYIKPVEQSYPG